MVPPSLPQLLLLLLLAVAGAEAKVGKIVVNCTILLYDDKVCATNSSVFEAAANLAVRRSRLPPTVQLNIHYMLTEDDCLETGGLLAFVRLMNDPTVGIVIGAVSHPVCQAAVSLAALRHKPFLSWSCSGLASNTSHTDNFARTVPPAWQVAHALVTLIQHFRWKYSVVVTTDDGQWPPLGYEIDMALREQRYIVRHFIILHRHGSVSEAKQRLASIGPLVKAVILCMEVTNAVMYNVLQAADELGMTQGKITFLALHVLYTLRPHAMPNVPSPHLLRYLFILTFISANSTYSQTWDDSQEEATLYHPDGAANNDTQMEDSVFLQVYDTVALFTSALRKAVQGRHFNLTSILRYTRDITFSGFLGSVRMSSKGDRDVTFVLLGFDGEHNAFRSALFVSNDSVTEASEKEWFASRLMPPDPSCILDERDCFSELGVSLSPAHIAALVVCSLLLTMFAIFIALFVRRRLLQNEMTKGPNKILILPEDLVFVSPRSLNASRKPSESLEGMLLHHFKVTSLGWPHAGRHFLKDTLSQQLNDFANIDKPDLLKGSHDSLRGRTNTSSLSVRHILDEGTTKARYNGDLVHVKYLHTQGFEIRSRTMKELKLLHDLRHENMNPFLGFLADPHRPAMIYEYCSRGSLEDIIASEDIKLDWAFKLSLLTDLVRGMKYLHSNPVRVHGWLTSRNCVIDSRWVLKLTDYGLPGFLESQNLPHTKRSAKDLLWTAPELLRDIPTMHRGTQPGDVYGFSIIMQEVVVRGPPYCMLSLTPEEIIEKVKRPPPLIRPSVSKQAAPPEAINIMRQCWAEVPEMRPDFNAIHEHFKKLNQGKKVNIVDTMFQMLEKYSNNLEELIRERTDQLAEEKKKTEQLLHRMLPSSVAEKLMLGMPVEPEDYEEVTIYFSDIVGFTTISAYSTPMEIVDLLNDLYTCFDATINGYNVYKVETIGDAYMVVGGLPLRIEDHACQIATMALDLLHQSGRFKIRHMPSTPLKLRIGLHTGSCCAGVVGLTMPRYCLFGDTVNTASRMESTGQAFRIHLSSTTKEKLDEAGGYHLQYRGETELKGKGKASTYWLLGKEGFDKELPTVTDDGLDEEIVRRGRLSSVCNSQQISPSDTPFTMQQIAKELLSPVIFAASLDSELRTLQSCAMHDTIQVPQGVTLPVNDASQGTSTLEASGVTLEIVPPSLSGSPSVPLKLGHISVKDDKGSTQLVPKRQSQAATKDSIIIKDSGLLRDFSPQKRQGSHLHPARDQESMEKNLGEVSKSLLSASSKDTNGNNSQISITEGRHQSVSSGDWNGNVRELNGRPHSANRKIAEDTNTSASTIKSIELSPTPKLQTPDPLV